MSNNPPYLPDQWLRINSGDISVIVPVSTIKTLMEERGLYVITRQEHDILEQIRRAFAAGVGR